MTIQQIIAWLQATHQRPAPPDKVAEELNRCTDTQAGMVVLGSLYRSLGIRFHTQRRQQFTPAQMQALRDAADFGAAGGTFANAFPTLHRVQIALQLMARVIQPSLVQQGPVQLCGPAAAAISMARHDPVRYVECTAELADKGRATIGGWTAQPALQILSHTPPQDQQADWILLASLRADARSLQDAMYGASGADDIFDILQRCGFRQVMLMCDFPTRIFRAHPQALLPPQAPSANKDSMAASMCGLSQAGWHVVLLGFGDLQLALQGVSQADQMRRDLAGDAAQNAAASQGRDNTVNRHVATLRTANPGLLRLGWAALTGALAAHTLHATYVSHARIEQQTIQLNCVNFGRQQRWVRLPLDAFVNKFVGFVAATDIG